MQHLGHCNKQSHIILLNLLFKLLFQVQEYTCRFVTQVNLCHRCLLYRLFHHQGIKPSTYQLFFLILSLLPPSTLKQTPVSAVPLCVHELSTFSSHLQVRTCGIRFSIPELPHLEQWLPAPHKLVQKTLLHFCMDEQCFIV